MRTTENPSVVEYLGVIDSGGPGLERRRRWLARLPGWLRDVFSRRRHRAVEKALGAVMAGRWI